MASENVLLWSILTKSYSFHLLGLQNAIDTVATDMTLLSMVLTGGRLLAGLDIAVSLLLVK